MWCWRRTEIRWTDREKSEAVLHTVEEERNILPTIKIRKIKWICHILRGNCLLRYVIARKMEGRIEVKERRGKRRKQLPDDLKERRGYWK
jgi:hypothetical protein